MEKIAVLLATYNGEKFLSQQLESLLDQSYRDWKLYVRDDCSSDTTFDIISDFRKKNPEKIVIIDNNSISLGAKMSFVELLKYAEEKYYMFCDQDDIWLPDKMEKSFSEMQNIERTNPEKPVLCFCDAVVTDENLNVISRSFWKTTRTDPYFLKKWKMFEVFNCAPGCTMIINQKLKNHLFPFPEKAPMHDWWITIVAQRKGIVQPIDQSLILYRQHSSNTIGAQEVDRKYFFKKLRTFLTAMRTQQTHLEFLKEINGMGKLEFYWTKLNYTIRRFIANR